MTITLDLPPHLEQAYVAEALAKGVPVDVVILNFLIARKPLPQEDDIIFDASHTASTGAALIAAMQASSHKDISLDTPRYQLPVRDVSL